MSKIAVDQNKKSDNFVSDPGRVKDLAQQIANKKLDPVTLVESYLNRINYADKYINAWCALDQEGAIKVAKQRALEARNGHIRGELHGVPVAVKDVIHVSGFQTKAYSPTREDILPQALDAQVVSALRESGAIILGKVHTTEFAFYESIPPTRNPYDLRRTPGGSSAGSAAAVASGMIPIAIGTQTAGSITRPATYCGIGGYKPSKQAISASGILPFAPSFDTIGMFGFNLVDAIYSFLAICPQYLRNAAQNSLPNYPRLILLEDDCLKSANPEIIENIQKAADFWSRVGWNVRTVKSPVSLQRVREHHTIIAEYELARSYDYLTKVKQHMVSDCILEAIKRGLSTTTDEYIDSRSIIKNLAEVFWSVFAYDEILIFPSTPAIAPAHNSTGDPKFIIPFTALNGPIANIKIGELNGMPIGAQLLGSPGLDWSFCKWICALDLAYTSKEE